MCIVFSEKTFFLSPAHQVELNYCWREDAAGPTGAGGPAARANQERKGREGLDEDPLSLQWMLISFFFLNFVGQSCLAVTKARNLYVLLLTGRDIFIP